MKRLLYLILAFLCAICLIFSGCAGENIPETPSGTLLDKTPADYLESQTPQTSDNKTDDTESTTENGGILVVYFSRSGNTEGMAESVASLTGGTLFEIEPSIPYSTNYQETVDRHKKELADNARPEIAHTVENWESYQTVFVGFPLWSGNAPMIIHSFMESYDFAGKIVIPFSTSGGSGGGPAYRNLADAYPDVAFGDGLNLTGSQIGSPDTSVTPWLTDLGLLKEGE